MRRDFFEHKADTYEQNKSRVDNVENIANSILSNVRLNRTMHLLDFGSGTGLLLERVAPNVKKITAIDVSSSMNKQLSEKRSKIRCDLEIIETDLAKTNCNQTFDGIISSMTMHHINDIRSMFDKFYSMLIPNGFIAIADLDKEDGSFHTEDTGVHHFGFDRLKLSKLAEDAGFKNIQISSASVVNKPHGAYSVFLLTAHR